MPRKIIIDVDTGTDDAVAIMLAALSEEIEVLGITTVNGNRCLDYTTDNTLRVVEHINAKIPVYRGCELPMVATLTPNRRPGVPYSGNDDEGAKIHGDHLPLPEATIKPEKEHAVFYIINTLMNSKEKITLIPVGPLTNIAMALRIEPRIVEKIDEIIIMGGAHGFGNTTPTAEFNIWMDPEAAKIVFDCGAKLTIVPLNATHRATISLEQCKELRALGTPAATAAATFIEKRIASFERNINPEFPNSCAVHDALTVAYAFCPEVLKKVDKLHVDVCIEPGVCDGETICTKSERHSYLPLNAYFAYDADRLKFFDILKDKFSKTL